MKRSEIIMDIASEIILYDISIDYKKAKELARIMLKEAKKAGMLPPLNKVDNFKDGYNRRWEKE